ncbi:SpoIIE family protein phosphatase [Streptomyces sp. DSM 44917]|uniref:SpoIIE family protein phosphatase n=1 Tax=Streptomyces boetiae TaxID=3075541 RepID=A0ABU2LEP6_9ACTN|nr:SpoIIE family protein phosphatase [Streptomyces sp. DSM 44917]MDT0310053.1 SpoIIE family protein phosphatase [Streptomyces sp. DSM 44917]
MTGPCERPPRPEAPSPHLDGATAVSVLQHLPDAFFLLDARTWRVLDANPAAEAIRRREGCEGQEGAPWEAMPGPDGLRATFEQVVAEGEPAEETVRHDGEGGTRWYRLRMMPVPPGLLVVVLADVTEGQLGRQAATDRARRVERLTAALAQALTPGQVVDAVARLVLPPFGANGLVVHTLRDGAPVLVGTAGHPREFVERLRRWESSGAPGPAHAREPLFLSDPEEFGRRWPHLAGAVRAGGQRSWAVLPLEASGHVVGTCVLSRPEAEEFTADDRGLLLALSGLIAQALERARLFEAERDRAERLQDALLPRVLPELPALTAAARYRPGGEEGVGGSWYDVVPLSADRVGLVIGNVPGSGLDSAIIMGRLRTAVRSLTALDYPPDDLLAHLGDAVSDITADLGRTVTATVLYAVYDPTTGVCTLAGAGQPGPAVLHPDGRTEFPAMPGGPPLGAEMLPYETRELTLPEGSVLVCCTANLLADGSGRARLAEVLGHAAAASAPAERRDPVWLGSLCDALTASELPAHPGRDGTTAVLAVRTRRLPRGAVARWELPHAPVAAGRARDLVREQLTAWGLHDLVTSTQLVVSELAGNAVRYATGVGGPEGHLTLRLIRSRTLTCELSDGSEATPRIRHPSLFDETGRGLQLVAAMTHRWGARYAGGGKIIWSEQLLPG